MAGLPLVGFFSYDALSPVFVNSFNEFSVLGKLGFSLSVTAFSRRLVRCYAVGAGLKPAPTTLPGTAVPVARCATMGIPS